MALGLFVDGLDLHGALVDVRVRHHLEVVIVTAIERSNSSLCADLCCFGTIIVVCVEFVPQGWVDSTSLKRAGSDVFQRRVMPSGEVIPPSSGAPTIPKATRQYCGETGVRKKPVGLVRMLKFQSATFPSSRAWTTNNRMELEKGLCVYRG